MSRGPWKRENTQTKRVTSIDELPAICTPADAGLLIGFAPEYVSRLAAAGVIRAFKLGGRWRIRRDDLKAFIDRQAELATAGR